MSSGYNIMVCEQQLAFKKVVIMKNIHTLADAITQLDSVEWGFHDAIDLDNLDELFQLEECRTIELGADLVAGTRRDRQELFFRTAPLQNHLNAWVPIPRACLAIVRALNKAEGLNALAQRAGLQRVQREAWPSDWIRWDPMPLPSIPVMTVNELAELCGGRHRVGARLLWWCAAAQDPQVFGYTALHRVRLLFGLGLWTRLRGREVQADRSLIDSMVAEARHLANHIETEATRKRSHKKHTLKDREFLLVAFLLQHHQDEIGNDREPLSQSEIAVQLGWSQAKVSRAFTKVFPGEGKIGYDRQFRAGKIRGFLERHVDGCVRVDGYAD